MLEHLRNYINSMLTINLRNLADYWSMIAMFKISIA